MIVRRSSPFVAVRHERPILRSSFVIPFRGDARRTARFARSEGGPVRHGRDPSVSRPDRSSVGRSPFTSSPWQVYITTRKDHEMTTSKWDLAPEPRDPLRCAALNARLSQCGDSPVAGSIFCARHLGLVGMAEPLDRPDPPEPKGLLGLETYPSQEAAVEAGRRILDAWREHHGRL